MASIADRCLDLGLNVLDTEANRFDITSQEATTYAEATSTYTLGNTTSISIGSPADRSGGGRKVTLRQLVMLLPRHGHCNTFCNYRYLK